jgi:tRNA threonylcarbamoyladenosine biosynthesis protein TsaE
MSLHSLMTHHATETQQLGQRLGAALRQSSLREQPVVIFLNGELGAGKTTFVGGLLRSLGIQGAVRSPTYTLIEPYETESIHLYHMDLYRIAAADELELLALKDMLQPGAVLLIEWALRAESALPPPDLVVSLEYPSQFQTKSPATANKLLPTVNSVDFDAQQRSIRIDARTTVGESLSQSMLAAFTTLR